MLGRLIGQRRWLWAAFGKHPAARDYFQVCLQNPLPQAFAQWVEDGFGRLPESTRRNGTCSWRFWSRGPKKNTLVCGLGKSSGDGVGRPYPLMLLGEGCLDRWEKHWNLLPFVLAPAWDKMEYSASRRMEHVRELETDLQRMQPPTPRWNETVKAIAHDLNEQETLPFHKIIMAEIQAKARTLQTEQKLVVPLDPMGQGESLQMAGAWHYALKAHFNGTPSTVFMGGNQQKSQIVFFNRPLAASDFVELWSV